MPWLAMPRREYPILVYAWVAIQFYCEYNIDIIYRYVMYLEPILCGVIDATP